MIYLITGVLGSGKTTIGRLLAEKLKCDFFDGDDYHSDHNRAKMAQGIPLDDEDRKPWLFILRAIIDRELARGVDMVMACSALKEKYRKALVGDRPGFVLVYLKGGKETIGPRIEGRKGHFVNPDLLESQFTLLEPPSGALEIDIKKQPEEIVAEILTKK